MGERIAEIPLAELGIEPGAAPAVERVVRIGVPSRELRAQRSRLESRPRARDFGDAHVLGEEVRRYQRESAHPMVLDAAGIDRGNRCPIAVADGKYDDSECIQGCKQEY